MATVSRLLPRWLAAAAGLVLGIRLLIPDRVLLDTWGSARFWGALLTAVVLGRMVHRAPRDRKTTERASLWEQRRSAESQKD